MRDARYEMRVRNQAMALVSPAIPYPASPIPYPSRLRLECGVEGDTRRFEVDPFHEGARLGSAGLAVHAAVLPLDGERAGIADVVEGADDLFKLNAAAAEGAEVPEAARVAKVEMAAEHAGQARRGRDVRVLHVDV